MAGGSALPSFALLCFALLYLALLSFSYICLQYCKGYYFVLRIVFFGTFAGGSALAGLGGALAAPRIAVMPGMESTIIVECFIIVIIGGLGSLWGSFVGALILGFVMTFGTVLVPEWELVLPYVLMLGILLWRPWGLFNKAEGEYS